MVIGLDPIYVRRTWWQQFVISAAMPPADSQSAQQHRCVDSSESQEWRQATSLQWIFDKDREDYDIDQRGIHFMNLSKLKYNSATMMPMGFFQQYRAHIINNASRAGDVITWNNNQLLHNDEIIGATFEGFKQELR